MVKSMSWADFAVTVLVTIVPVLVLLLALAPGHPYGYFIFLRWVVCVAALIFLPMFHGHQLYGWMYAFGFIALLYNPIFRVHLTRDIWMVLNVVTIVVFAAGFVVIWTRSRRTAKERSQVQS